MKDIVEFIVKQFVSNPDAVEVNETMQDEGYINITLKVAPEDMGLTIGKSGQTIKAIRRLLTIKAIAENARVNLELIDSGAPREAGKSKEPETEETKSEDSESKETEESSEKKAEEPEVTEDKEEKSES